MAMTEENFDRWMDEAYFYMLSDFVVAVTLAETDIAAKETIRQQLSEEKTGKAYGKRKSDVEPVFGFLKTNLRFTRMSVRGEKKVENELGFAFMAVNLRKYTAKRSNVTISYENNPTKNGSNHQKNDDRNHFLFI